MNEQSHLAWGTPWDAWTVAGLAIAALAALGFYYGRTYRRFGRRFLVVSMLLRLAALAALLACLVQPSLVVTRTLVDKGRVVLLLDQSRSMELVDLDGGRSRWDEAREVLLGEGGGLARAMADRFDVAIWTFADGAWRREPDEVRQGMQATGPATWISRALAESVADLQGRRLAGVVLVSDGLDNGGEDPLITARALGVPIHTVAVGHERGPDYKDIVLEKLVAPERVVRNEPMLFIAQVRSTGYTNKVVPLRLDLGDKNIANQLIPLKTSPAVEEVRIRYTPTEKGTFTFTATVPPDTAEAVVGNNSRRVTVEVIEPTIDVLYIEGALRFEFKFLRRVLTSDPYLRVVSLLQTGPDTFYKQVGLGTGDAEASGAPAEAQSSRFPEPEALREFEVFIIGDVGADSLRPDQLKAIAQAVEQQGAALIMLGGRHTFGSGGYAGTPLADVLPVRIGSREDGQEFEPFQVSPTPEGLQHPILKLDPDEDRNLAIWKHMPALDGCNRVLGAKPGAQVLLRHELRQGPTGTGALVILAVQRYGKGKAVALTADSTWRWAFQVLGTGGDQTLYAAFWRQLLRWLLPDKELPPDRSRLLEVTTDQKQYRPGETVHIEATVLTPDLKLAVDAAAQGQLRLPDGRTQELALAKAAGQDGKYQAAYLPRRLGRYELSVRAERHGQLLAEQTVGFEVGVAGVELERTEPDFKLLADLARATGGQSLRPSEARRLLELLKPADTVRTETREELLWHTPSLLAAFIGLLSLEWVLRRRYSLR